MKITRRQLRQIIKEELARVVPAADTITETAMVALQPMTRPNYKDMSSDDLWMRIAGIDTKSLREGDIVDLFSDDQDKQNATEEIARALANRTAEMLNNALKKGLSDEDIDLDIERERPDYIDMNIDPELFLTPYADIDGDGRLVRPLAQSVYEDYVSGKSGDQAHSLEDIIERIGIDYFDEPIEYALVALGDDRFTMSHTWKEEGKEEMQMARTQDLASQQDVSDIDPVDDEGVSDFERYLQGIESGDVVELEQED